MMAAQNKKPKTKQKIHNEEALRSLEIQFEQLQFVSGAFDQTQRASRAEQCRILCNQAYNLYNREKYRDAERQLWERAAALFHKAVSEAYPANFWEDYNNLKKGDLAGLEAGITFLENDPFFLRSGYVKADLLKFISYMKVPEKYSSRLKNILLDAVSRRGGREFRHYCRLTKFIDREILRKDLAALAKASDPGISRRALWVIESIKSYEQ